MHRLLLSLDRRLGETDYTAEGDRYFGDVLGSVERHSQRDQAVHLLPALVKRRTEHERVELDHQVQDVRGRRRVVRVVRYALSS